MLYNCKIINIEEEEITIKIGEVYITGFTNCSVNKGIGEDEVVDISLYDEFDYGYLDGKQVKMDVLRLDFDFK